MVENFSALPLTPGKDSLTCCLERPEPEGAALLRHLSPMSQRSSLEARHFALMLPAANIKTRAELMSLSGRSKLVNWPMTDSHGILSSFTRMEGRGWLDSLIFVFCLFFCPLLTQKSREGEKKKTFHQLS